jgi:polysaccharide deacetylase family protein (PEP-CTERM system associated)
MQETDRFRKKHILSIALEDYFHGPAFSDFIDRKYWARFETRFEQNCLNVLDRLDRYESKATFFVSAWVAQSRPDLSREVIRRGHELALAGSRGVSFRFLSPDELRKRVRADCDVLEAACQRKVLGYRVSDVLLKEGDLWALEVLAEMGFSYDSSLSPFLWRFRSQPWRQFIHQNVLKNNEIWEVPLASYRFAGMHIPIAGGNYFRQFPERLVRSALRKFESSSAHPLVLYFRLWDFDPDQPLIETGSLIRKFRHYRNRERIVDTLADLLNDYHFTSIAEYLGLSQPEVSTPVSVPRPVEVVAKRIGAAGQQPVSVIIPCYNEEATVPYLLNTLRDLKSALSEEYDLQFVLVDDCSKDNTWQALSNHFSDRADTILIRHEQNRGVAGAIATGLERSREIACSMDCDCSYDPLLLAPMLKLMRDGTDLVTASPYHPAGSVLHVPKWRLGLSWGASALYRAVTGRKLHTFTSCFRVYRRSAILPIALKHSGFLGIAELVGRMPAESQGIVEYPATLESRIFGRSKMKVLRTMLGHLGLLADLAWARVRRQYRAVAAPPNNSSAGAKSAAGAIQAAKSGGASVSRITPKHATAVLPGD